MKRAPALPTRESEALFNTNQGGLINLFYQTSKGKSRGGYTRIVKKALDFCITIIYNTFGDTKE